MADNLKCVICASEQDKKVLLFSEETLKKCRCVLDLRKHHNLKYKDVILPSDLYDCGYHRSCYRVFTAIKLKFYEKKGTKIKDVASVSQSNTLSTESLSAEQPSTSTYNSMIAQTVTEDVNLSIDSSALDEVVMKSNNSQLDTSLEAGIAEDSNLSNSQTDILTAENEIPIVKDTIFFCDKKKIKNFMLLCELETEATYTSTSRAGLCSEVINRTDNLSVGIAYDNFDRFVDTKTGKETLHDTVGIIYQNIDPTLENIEDIEDVDDLRDISTKRRQRRSFEAIDPELPFFHKKSKMSSGFRPEISEKEDENIIMLQDLYNRIDTVWMLSHAVRLPDIPM
ncbi:hypothetical protein WA026_012796 [Henosepilachna vigintioctopunctata]|uniref:Uncharacterized protein n=1 Tax=Henosepilachna vigintioctopunctata TaxID=420089 RepID=A0AAW1U0R2_9CUCU